MKVIAIDPGKTGYIVSLDSDTRIAKTMALPFRPDEVLCYRTIRQHFDLLKSDLILLEKVSCQPHWSATSGMTFGKIVGQLQMMLSPYCFTEVNSRIWQREVHIGFADHMDAKAKSLAAFHRINPNYQSSKKPDHNMVDAFLIAIHGLHINGINQSGEWNFEHVPKITK
jgi:hypothetical protein